MNMRKKYIKPTVKVAEIDGDLTLLAGSPEVGGNSYNGNGITGPEVPSDEE